MSPEERGELEAAARELHGAGAIERAATVALEGYGPEVLSYLIAVLGDESAGEEVFAIFCEHFWVGLPSFEWRSSLRTWAYVVARRAITRVTDSAYARRSQRLGTVEAQRVAVEVRSRTRPYLRTEVKDRFTALRDELSESERELLVLRVDRGLEWVTIAEILAPDDADAAAVKRKSASLRKRFERVKDKLRGLAIEAGLLDA